VDGGSVSFALAFAAGLASFVSPCVLPVVPGYVSFVTGVTLDEAGARGGAATDGCAVRRGAAAHAALFVLGFSALFIVLGASATALGTVVRRSLPLIQQVGGAVIVLFGLYVLGLIRMPLLLREWRVHLAAKPAGRLGSVVAGIAFGAGWTPCIGPVLATILLYAGMSGTMLHGAALLATYALGLGLPFFVAAVSLTWFLERTRWLRRWMVPIERAAGAVMVVAGALLFSGHFSALSRFFSR
jgi:cytochrome c-type biogenesis protein